MPNKLLCSIIFGAGVAVGAALAFRFAEKKYRSIADEEIESVKEAFRKNTALLNTISHEVPVDNPPDNLENDQNIQAVSEINVAAPYEPCEIVETPDRGYIQEEPFISNAVSVIPPDEYGDEDDYDLYEWTFYADGVLADDGDDAIARNDFNGIRINDHFGEYEEDTVYLKDNDRRAYYAIFYDSRTYDEVLQTIPPDIRKLTLDSED